MCWSMYTGLSWHLSGLIKIQPLGHVCCRLIAKEMAKLHSIPLEVVQTFIGTDKASTVNLQPCLWGKIQKYLDLVPEAFADPQKQQRWDFERYLWLLKNACNFSQEKLSLRCIQLPYTEAEWSKMARSTGQSAVAGQCGILPKGTYMCICYLVLNF